MSGKKNKQKMSSIRDIMDANTDSEDPQGATMNYTRQIASAAETSNNDANSGGIIRRNLASDNTTAVDADGRRGNIFFENFTRRNTLAAEGTRSDRQYLAPSPPPPQATTTADVRNFFPENNEIQNNYFEESIREHILSLNNSVSGSRVYFENAVDEPNNSTASIASLTMSARNRENEPNAMRILRDPLSLHSTSSTTNLSSRTNDNRNSLRYQSNYQQRQPQQNNLFTTSDSRIDDNIFLPSGDNEVEASIGTRNCEASDRGESYISYAGNARTSATRYNVDDGDENFINLPNRHRNETNAAVKGYNDPAKSPTINANSRNGRRFDDSTTRRNSTDNDDDNENCNKLRSDDDDERLFRIKRKLDVVFIMNQVRQMFGDKNQMYSEQLLQDFKELFEQDLSSSQISKIFILLKRQASSMCSSIHFVGNVISDVIKDNLFSSILGDRLIRQFSECFDNFLASTTMDGFFMSDVLTASDDKLREIVQRMPGSWIEMGRFVAGLGFCVVAKLFADNVCAMIKTEKSKMRNADPYEIEAHENAFGRERSFPTIEPMPYASSDLRSVDVESNQLNSPLFHIPGGMLSSNDNDNTSTVVETISTQTNYKRRKRHFSSGNSGNDENDSGEEYRTVKNNNLVVDSRESLSSASSAASQLIDFDETQSQPQSPPPSTSSIYTQRSPSRAVVGKQAKKKRFKTKPG